MREQTWFRNVSLEDAVLPLQVTGASNTYEGTEIRRPSGFEDHQLTYCMDGEGVFEAEGRQARIGPGMLFFFRSGVPHSYGPLTFGWRLKWASFTGKGCGDILNHLQYQDTAVFTQGHPDVGDWFDQLAVHLGHEDLIRSAILMQTLLTEARPVPAPSEDRLRLDRIAHIIRDRYQECLTLEDLAHAYGSSASYLCRAYRTAFGTTPIDALNRHRITVAKTLLLDPRMKVHDISRAVGFSTPDAFRTAFRKQSGHTPTQFRQRYGIR